MSQLKPIDQQVVVVMGASSGIGRAAALRFAQEGARVVVSARSEQALNSLVEQIQLFNGEAIAVPADVTDFSQVQHVAAAAAERFGRIDTWVHVAAVSLYATVEDTTLAEFRQILDVNLMGQVHGAKAALPYLRREGRGALIHVSSIEAMRALPYQGAYAASKHGVKGFIESLRMELKHEGLPISVTNVMPASINTPLFDHARTKIGTKPKGLPPIYQPEVVVEAIVHAAANPERDIFAGGAARVFAMTQALSPKLLDTMMLATAFKGQRTSEPKSTDAPDNLFEPMDAYPTIYGDFGEQALGPDSYTPTETMDGLKVGLGSLLLGAVAGMAWRRLGSRA